MVNGVKLNFNFWPIGQEKIEGYVLVFYDDEELTERDFLAANLISLAAMVEMAHQREIIEQDRRCRDEFVRDLIFNNFDTIDALHKRGKIWGWNLDLSHIAMVIEEPGSWKKAVDAGAEIRLVADKYFAVKLPGSVVGEIGNLLVVLFPWLGPSDAGWRCKEVKRVLTDSCCEQRHNT